MAGDGWEPRPTAWDEELAQWTRRHQQEAVEREGREPGENVVNDYGAILRGEYSESWVRDSCPHTSTGAS